MGSNPTPSAKGSAKVQIDLNGFSKGTKVKPSLPTAGIDALFETLEGIERRAALLKVLAVHAEIGTERLRMVLDTMVEFDLA